MTDLGKIQQNCASEIGFLFSHTYLQPAHVCSVDLCNVQLKDLNLSTQSTQLFKSTELDTSLVSILKTTESADQSHSNSLKTRFLSKINRLIVLLFYYHFF